MTLRRVAAALVTTLAVAGAVLLWPARLGGAVSYVITHGVSMQPRFHTGDLAVVRRAGSYHVGEIAAYHSPSLHTVVLHRIVAIVNGRYIFKGDHNTWLDADHVGRSQILGRLWVHVPAVGNFVWWLVQPLHLLLLVVGLLLLTGGETARRRRPSTREVLPVALVVAVAGAALAGWAWTQPARATVVRHHGYTQTVRFGYAAQVPPDAVYPSGHVATGDPLFVRLVPRLVVRVDYQTTARDAAGTIGLIGSLANNAGWHTSFTLAPVHPFTGASTSAQGLVSLPALVALSHTVDAQSGVSLGGYTLTLTPVVLVHGQVSGVPVGTTMGAPFVFRFDDQQFSPAAAYSTTTSGSVPVAASVPARPTLLHHRIPLPAARWLGLLVALLSAAAAFGLALASRRPRQFIGPHPLPCGFEGSVISIVADSVPPDRFLVDTDSFADLVAAAATHAQPILHDKPAGICYVENDGTVYRFRLAAPRLSLVPPLPEQRQASVPRQRDMKAGMLDS
jgi:signal peptidase I